MANAQAAWRTKEQVELIETVLPVNPIKSAKRVNGEIWVELLWYHGPDAPESERFPQ